MDKVVCCLWYFDDSLAHNLFCTIYPLLQRGVLGRRAVCSLSPSQLAADAQDQMDYREYFNRCGMPAKDKGGDERFIFGSKISQTSRQVAREDPSYHLRCYAAGYNPIPIQMDRNCKYFATYGHQHAAAWSDRDSIELAARV